MYDVFWQAKSLEVMIVLFSLGYETFPIGKGVLQIETFCLSN